MGHPVAHSRSPMLHGYWLRTLGIDGAYEFADVAPENFETFFRGLGANGFAGGNITIPHKEAAFRLVDRRERAADTIGAVNTVWYEDGALIGGNTDWLGIVRKPRRYSSRLGCIARQGRRARRRRLGARLGVRDFSSADIRSRSSIARCERAEKLAAVFGARASAHGTDALPRSCSPTPTC